MSEQQTKNKTLLRSLWLPTIFLSVALLGGLRVDAATHSFLFLPPPLVTLLLAVLLCSLFVRGQLVILSQWLSSNFTTLANISHALTLITLFFASSQALNSALPERGLLHWLFSFFFLWTLLNNQFAPFDARRLLRSLGVLFGTAFILKYMILASLYAQDGGWLKTIAGALLQGATLGTLDAESFAPATGYISFFTLALFVTGLALLIPATETNRTALSEFMSAYGLLAPQERARVRQALFTTDDAAAQIEEPLQLHETVEAAEQKNKFDLKNLPVDD